MKALRNSLYYGTYGGLGRKIHKISTLERHLRGARYCTTQVAHSARGKITKFAEGANSLPRSIQPTVKTLAQTALAPIFVRTIVVNPNKQLNL
jgi:hypothetical protein